MIETVNFYLNSISSNNAVTVFELFSNEDVLIYTDNDLHKTINDSISLINKVAENEKNGLELYRALIDKQNDKMIGLIRLVHIDKKHKFASIGCMLLKQYWNKGIMSECIPVFVQFGFESLNLKRIEAQIFVEHHSSIRLFEKVGFLREGLLRSNFLIKNNFESSYMYSILNNNYK